MNMSLIKGACMYSLGAAEELYGCVVGNPELRMAGDQMKICGKFHMLIGDAQSLINHCVKRKNAPVRRLGFSGQRRIFDFGRVVQKHPNS